MLDGVGAHVEHDRNRGGRLLGRPSGGRPDRQDEIHLEQNQLGREGREPVQLRVRMPGFDDEVRSLHVPEGAQRLSDERAELCGGRPPATAGTRQHIERERPSRESTEEEVAARVDGICRGLGVDLPAGSILYRPMYRALADEAPRLRADFARHGVRVSVVILDSFGPAAGAEPESADSTFSPIGVRLSGSGVDP